MLKLVLLFAYASKPITLQEEQINCQHVSMMEMRMYYFCIDDIASGSTIDVSKITFNIRENLREPNKAVFGLIKYHQPKYLYHTTISFATQLNFGERFSLLLMGIELQMANCRVNMRAKGVETTAGLMNFASFFVCIDSQIRVESNTPNTAGLMTRVQKMTRIMGCTVYVNFEGSQNSSALIGKFSMTPLRIFRTSVTGIMGQNGSVLPNSIQPGEDLVLFDFYYCLQGSNLSDPIGRNCVGPLPDEL